ncbi:MAG: phosphoglycerate mutase (2,3-diphosphoglycerate-independent), partial [Chloroflexi bacterium]
TMTRYRDDFPCPVAFAEQAVEGTLAEVLAEQGSAQLHAAETEKYAHVTYFFNCGVETPYPGEDRILVPSQKVATYDLMPEMSAPGITDQLVADLDARRHRIIICNFANADMVGHTGNLDAAIAAVETLDRCLARIVTTVERAGGSMIITADHGNLEEMIGMDGSPHVAHTANLVKFILIDPRSTTTEKLRDGKLADVAPTVLSVLGLAQPEDMAGKTLTVDHDWGGKRRVLLLILDGWGIGRHDSSNAIFLAQTPVWDELLRHHSGSRLEAAGEAVGLQPGKTGNSEAGHMNLGAGRVVLQDDVRLDLAMQDGSFYTNEILCRALVDVKSRGAGLHLIGLLSEKSSHGSVDYPLALLRMAKEHGLKDVYLHMILDGRSTEPGSAPVLFEKLQGEMEEIGVGQVVSVVGRGIALDRDGNYAKTRRAYEAFVYGKGAHFVMDREGQ